VSTFAPSSVSLYASRLIPPICLGSMGKGGRGIRGNGMGAICF